MKVSHLIILLAMNFCWAAVYAVYKIIAIPTGAVVTLRFGLAGVCLLLLWPLLPGPSPRGRDLLLTCLMGVITFTIGQRLQVYGNEIGTAGNSAVLMAMEPLVTSVAAALFLGEHIGPRRIAGFALGLVGVAMLHGVWHSDFHWVGTVPSLIFISSFICEAAYSIIGKPIIARASVMKTVALSLIIGTALNLAIDGSRTITIARQLPFGSWVFLFAMAFICTVLGYSLWFVVIRECPVNVAALTIFAQSIFGVLIAAVWIREKLHWGQLLGSVTIAAGLVIGLSRQVKGIPAHNVSPP
jgi:drug/metabolite transporter (DMT)-like permease